MLLLFSLQIFGLFIDPEFSSGDRITYNITMVLAFMLSNVQFTQDIPYTSQRIFIFEYIFCISYVTSAIAVYSIFVGILVKCKKFTRQRKFLKLFNLSPIRLFDIFIGILSISIVVVATVSFYFALETSG